MNTAVSWRVVPGRFRFLIGRNRSRKSCQESVCSKMKRLLSGENVEEIEIEQSLTADTVYLRILPEDPTCEVCRRDQDRQSTVLKSS